MSFFYAQKLPKILLGRIFAIQFKKLFFKAEIEAVMKKFIVLGILFLLPISVYMFFATGVNNFVKLPVLTNNVNEISNWQSLDGETIQLNDRITVLQFMGKDISANRANAFNLAHKIYKKNT